jgi:hypothetical protein
VGGDDAVFESLLIGLTSLASETEDFGGSDSGAEDVQPTSKTASAITERFICRSNLV